MEIPIKMLLELLAEERVKRGRLENELNETIAKLIEVENKNLELIIERRAPHTPPPTPSASFDVHSGLEKLTLNPPGSINDPKTGVSERDTNGDIRVKPHYSRSRNVHRLEASNGSIWDSNITCDC